MYYSQNYFRIIESALTVYMYFYLPYNFMLQLLKNDLEVTRVDLTDTLPAATVMVVSVTASTTQG